HQAATLALSTGPPRPQPASPPPPHSLLRPRANRYCLLPPPAGVPPTGRGVKYRSGNPGPTGWQSFAIVVASVPEQVVPNFLSVSSEIVRIRGPSWFSSYPRTECAPPA